MSQAGKLRLGFLGLCDDHPGQISGHSPHGYRIALKLACSSLPSLLRIDFEGAWIGSLHLLKGDEYFVGVQAEKIQGIRIFHNRFSEPFQAVYSRARTNTIITTTVTSAEF